ncbi:MAG: hypothetical protein HS111_21910 [Kofleriaceae bacterium]|nr:hypothetical protein [Kofleriaceae bacterium]MCL4224348.1 hypothetical protein [Myxococcales bacterium]
MQDLRRALVSMLSTGTWSDIKRTHARVNLEWREDLQPGSGKPAYATRVLDALDEPATLALATRCVKELADQGGIIELQNALWHHESSGRIDLTPVTRQAFADLLDRRGLPGVQSVTAFLEQFATPQLLGAEATYDGKRRLIYRESAFLSDASVISHRNLLALFGFNDWPDKRVFQMFEKIVDPMSLDAGDQLSWVEALNGLIAVDGFLLREASRISGRAVFRVHRQRSTHHRRPKNLIFASTGPKPTLGFADALDNDVVILEHAEHCLIFDDHIGDEGLTWTGLVGWFARGKALSDETARKDLGKRLLASVGSEPEGRFFGAYFRIFAHRLADRLPALLPQVYLHYDPATLAELRCRNLAKRFLCQRMDFLMLLPGGARVVLEIDGQQHYATSLDADARPSPQVYAETVRGDRELRLAGYEVYRFGGAELTKASAGETVRTFFDHLFARHSITQ